MRLNLSEYKKNYFSQCGEDGVINKLLEIMDLNSGYLVEFGAWNGIYLSNTYYHYCNNSKFGLVMIESDITRYMECKTNINDETAIILNNKIEVTGENSLNNIFDKYKIKEIALLSIDVDGDDFEIFKSLDTKIYKPSIVCIEIPYWQDKEYMMNVVNTFNEKGYNLTFVTGNYIFTHKDFLIKSEKDIFESMILSDHPEILLHNNLISEKEYEKTINKLPIIKSKQFIVNAI